MTKDDFARSLGVPSEHAQAFFGLADEDNSGYLTFSEYGEQ
jgi:hypothetical protein